MIEPVSKILKKINEIEDIYHEIDEYKCNHGLRKSWADLVECELRKKSFTELEKINIRRAIDTLEFIESHVS